ncbi:MAG TPA: YafY family protein [Steroidobacter sp.]|uniref:helix-turn-helix transcriptional regulator n=1 Tax=Steroidobacter sp. TaxID=1978227 RepID=UPI002ED9BD3C
MRRAERLFRIVSLFRGRRLRTAAELAQLLEVSERTIYRDIAHLQGSGVGIDGVGGLGYVADQNMQLPPLNFSADQIEALSLGLSFVVAAGDAKLAESARAAQTKIEAVLPRTLHPSLSNAALVAFRRASGRAPAHAALLRGAIRARRIVEFDYASERSARMRRRVRPLSLSAFSDCWTVTAWCEARRALRDFRLDRMEHVEMSHAGFESIPDYDIDDFVSRRKALPTRKGLPKAPAP